MEDKTDLFARGVEKKEHQWAKIRCAELGCTMGEYIGRLIRREKNTIEKARANRRERTVKRDPKKI